MALLKLDTNHFELKVHIGVLESYSPDSETVKLHEDVADLKQLIKVKAETLTGETETKAAAEKLRKDKELLDQWTKFLADEVNPELVRIQRMIHEKNKLICKGYTEVASK